MIEECEHVLGNRSHRPKRECMQCHVLLCDWCYVNKVCPAADYQRHKFSQVEAEAA